MRRIAPASPAAARRATWTAALALVVGGTMPSMVLQAQAPGHLLWERWDGAHGVAVSIHFPTGHVDDPAGSEGTALLLGRVIEAEGERRLATRSGRAHVEVGQDRVTVTFFVPAAAWGDAWREMAALLTTAPLPEESVLAARARLVDELLFESGSPVRSFEAEWRSFRLRGLPGGVSDVGGSTGVPTIPSVSGLTGASLEAFRSARLRWEDAVVAVVGPVDESAVRALGARRIEQAPAAGIVEPDPVPPTAGDSIPDPPPPVDEGMPPSPLRIGVPAAELRVGPDPAGAARWGSIDRGVGDHELTSSWIGVAWLLPAGAPWTLADFMAHLIRDALNPSPPDPALYRADVRVEEVGGASLLTVVATVDPQATIRWEARILAALDELSSEPPIGAFFELARRRYRSARLLEASDPALRARELAIRSARDGSITAFSSEVWGLSRDGLRDLAARRGEPRILIHGPVRMMDGN